MKTILNISKRRALQTIGALIATGVLIFAFAGCGIFSNPDYAKLQGVWEAKSSESRIIAIVVQDETVIVLPTDNDKPIKGKFQLTSGPVPQFDITFDETSGDSKEERWQGIYDLKDKTFKAALSYNVRTPRPTEFTQQNTWNFEWKGEAKDFAPADLNYQAGLATWHYWMDFSGIHKRHNMVNPFTEGASPEQVLEQCEKATAVLAEVRADVSRLSVARVDARATTYVSEYVATLNELESVFRDVSSIIKDAQALQAKRSSDELLGITIIEFFLGRPGATIDALDAEAQQLKNRVLALREKATNGGKMSDRLGTEQLKLRSYLSDKYGREFRQFEL
jgi:uncharacterized protein (TIGR03067 family)